MWERFSIGEAALRPAARRAVATVEKYMMSREKNNIGPHTDCTEYHRRV